MLKYKEAPWWWYAILLALSFFAGMCLSMLITVLLDSFFSGLIVTFKGQTTLPWWSYVIALIFGAFVTVLYLVRLVITDLNVSYSPFLHFYTPVWVMVLQRIN